MRKLSQQVDRKFVDVIDISEYEVLSDTGFEDIASINKTVEYVEWEVITDSGKSLICADTHIFMDKNHIEVFAKDALGVELITKDGIETVISVIETEKSSNMFDLSINSEDHTYFTNDILSHNTAVLTAYILWRTTFNKDIKVGVAAHKGSGAKEIVARFKYAYEFLPSWMKAGVKAYNVFDVEFDNGSALVSQTTTGTTFRGLSMTMIYLDEFAFVAPRIADEFWTSLLPSTTAGDSAGEFDEDGNPIEAVKIIATSTPNGSEGLFARLWFQSQRDPDNSMFHGTRVYNEEVPNRDEAFKKKMLRSMTPLQYSQEFDCAFVSNKGTLINSQILEGIRGIEPENELLQGIRIYDPLPFLGKRIGISIDVAEGIGGDGDYTTIQFFDIDTLHQVAEFDNNEMTVSEFAKFFIQVLIMVFDQKAREVYYTVESNPIGLSVINLLRNSTATVLDRAEMVSDNHRRGGILTTNKSKVAGCSMMKDLVENNRMFLHSKKLLSELKFFVKKGASFSAENGMHDDLVMGVVVFCNMLALIAKQDDFVHDNINKLDMIDCIESADLQPMPFVF